MFRPRSTNYPFQVRNFSLPYGRELQHYLASPSGRGNAALESAYAGGQLEGFLSVRETDLAGGGAVFCRRNFELTRSFGAFDRREPYLPLDLEQFTTDAAASARCTVLNESFDALRGKNLRFSFAGLHGIRPRSVAARSRFLRSIRVGLRGARVRLLDRASLVKQIVGRGGRAQGRNWYRDNLEMFARPAPLHLSPLLRRFTLRATPTSLRQRRDVWRLLRTRRYTKTWARLPNLLCATWARARALNTSIGLPLAFKWSHYSARKLSSRKLRRRSYIRGLWALPLRCRRRRK